MNYIKKENKIIWTSKNGIYQLSKFNNRYQLDNNKLFISDYPINVNGDILYDNPYNFPTYVKNKVKKYVIE